LAADGLWVTTAFGNDNRLTYTYGSAAAHVAVDPGTGDVELLDCLVWHMGPTKKSTGSSE
jgi:CO/xanthine dehydrogenase Mo-binding subunit